MIVMLITLSKKILDNYNADPQHRGWPVTGVIVEPIQAEGGDHHGSNAWFQVYNNSYYSFSVNTFKMLPSFKMALLHSIRLQITKY